MIESKQVLTVNGDPALADLREYAVDETLPRTAYVFAFSLPEEVKAQSVAQAEKLIRTLAELAGGEVDDDLTEQLQQIAEQTPDYVAIGEPLTLCWN